jgi:uncharacterized protein
MAKTALELTPAEQMAYYPSAVIEQRKRAGDRLTEARWRQAQLLARQAAWRLREEFGAKRVRLFGSAAQRPRFTTWSDVDLAVWGILPQRFYAAVAAVTGISAEIRVDLVDAEQCSRAVQMAIEQDGVEL